MKRHFAGIILLLFVGTVSWGQGTKEPFDIWKSRVEMEIMREILSTTIKFVNQNSQTGEPPLRFSNLNSFYLAGQGAVFVIPTYKLFSASSPGVFERMAEYYGELSSDYSLERSLDAVRARLEALSKSFGTGSGIGSGMGSGVGGGVDSGYGPYVSGNGVKAPVPPVPPAPPAPPSAPAPPAASSKPEKPEKPPRPEIDREELRKWVEATKEKIKKDMEDAEATRKKLLQSLSEIKICLIEALANYGDSMTTVKPDEYINVVIVTDGFGDQRMRSDVISARKSWITDYKAGKLSLESFKQKVIQYSE